VVFVTYMKHDLVPCMLLPRLQMIQQGTNNVYPEVEGLSLLLGFKTQNAGCCKVSGACWCCRCCSCCCW
jgi:hypothetical protein